MSNISKFSIFKCISSIILEKLSNAVTTVISYPDTISFLTVSCFCLVNKLPIRKSILYGDIAGVAYQSLNLLKETQNKPNSNWTKLNSGKYMLHGFAGIISQLSGIYIVLSELSGNGINNTLFTVFAIANLLMCYSCINLIVHTPYSKWTNRDQIIAGNNTYGFQTTFIQPVLGSSLMTLHCAYFLFQNKYYFTGLFIANILIVYIILVDLIGRCVGLYYSLTYNKIITNKKITSIGELFVECFTFNPTFSNMQNIIASIFTGWIPYSIAIYDMMLYKDVQICEKFAHRIMSMIILNTLAVNSNSFDVSLFVSKKISKEQFNYITIPRFAINCLTVTSIIDNNVSLLIAKNIFPNCS